jgi:hypothetical protein
MSTRSSFNPFFVYPRILGAGNMIGGFFSRRGLQQSLTGNGGVVDVGVYHTKLFTDSDQIFEMPAGYQDGQLKLITLVRRGGLAEVRCPDLMGDDGRITFSHAGDQIELMWANSSWCVVKSWNMLNLELETPVVD